MSKKQVTICGVNFGSFYINALKDSKEYEINGILSKGSEKSRMIAKELGVGLFTDSEETDDADMVIMATRSMITGGKSTADIKKLLTRGIDVLQEQPVHFMEVQDILKSVKSYDQKYGVNNFYRFLPAVDAFIRYAKKLIAERHVLRIRMSCASQVLYPLMDVLCHVVGTVDSFEVNKGFGENLSVMYGNINDIPIVLNYYNEYTEDIDGSLALFFDIKLETDAGNLILTDPEGELIWQSHLSYSREEKMDSDEFRNTKPMQYLFRSTTDSYYDRYSSVWPEAMKRSIDYFTKAEADEVKGTTLKACEMSLSVTNAAGRPCKIEIPYCNGISL